MKKEKFYQKTWFTILFLILFFPIGLITMWRYKKFNKVIRIIISAFYVLSVISSFFGSDSDTDSSKPATTAATSTTAKATTKTTASKTTTAKTTEAATAKKKKSKSKDISKYYIVFYDEYNNDTTGRWRLAETSDDFDIWKYAVSYYDNYFKAKDEVHILVNFRRNTTTAITNMGGILDVRTHDYVDGEEHDASTALEGTLLSEYHVNIKTGKITKVQ